MKLARLGLMRTMTFVVVGAVKRFLTGQAFAEIAQARRVSPAKKGSSRTTGQKTINVSSAKTNQKEKKSLFDAGNIIIGILIGIVIGNIITIAIMSLPLGQ